MNDAFSKCHPLINFAFFAGAIAAAAVISHPLYLLLGLLSGASYYLLLNGRKAWSLILRLVPLFIFVTAINPLLNTQGETSLFQIFGRPYTLEALCYGAAAATIFILMLLWFGCCSKVLTGDKFTCLFGHMIPAISLVLLMVFRMVPNILRKAGQVTGARKSIGKAAGENALIKEKLKDTAIVLASLTSWAFEGGIVAADSMRSRGYGVSKRSSFMIYRMGKLDWSLLFMLPVLLILIIIAAGTGQMQASFTPKLYISPVSWGIIPYAVYFFIPTVLHIEEAILWNISRYRI